MNMDKARSDALVPRVRSAMADALGDLDSINLSLYGELERLATLIESMKSDIAAMQGEGGGCCTLPGASDELDAVIGATEAAADTILDAAETVESVASRIEATESAILLEAVTRIYEACNFQDLAGQRIRKVARTLKQVEEGLIGLLEGFGGAAPQPGPAAAAESLTNGPQLPQHAPGQDAIDALFAQAS